MATQKNPVSGKQKQHKNLSSILSTHIKRSGMVVYICHPNAEEVETGDMGLVSVACLKTLTNKKMSC